jgi:hypothetical protein
VQGQAGRRARRLLWPPACGAGLQPRPAPPEGHQICGPTPAGPCPLQVIPAENLVAALQGGPAQLFACAASAADAQVMLEALEVGVQGVLLRSDDPVQVRRAGLLLGGRLVNYLVLRARQPVAAALAACAVGRAARALCDAAPPSLARRCGRRPRTSGSATSRRLWRCNTRRQRWCG